MDVTSFPPAGSADATTLILGSMPGVASLNEQQYYAHPRNALWPILLALLTDQSVSYELTQAHSYKERLTLLEEHRIVLWDVLASCHRPGSLDASIKQHSVVTQDFGNFLDAQTSLNKIAFNGKAAEKLFKRHCLPGLRISHATRINAIEFRSLPSTSPAMASLKLDAKLKRWQSALLPQKGIPKRCQIYLSD